MDIKKLSLDRETLRVLRDEETSHVAAAGSSTSMHLVPTVCLACNF